MNKDFSSSFLCVYVKKSRSYLLLRSIIYFFPFYTLITDFFFAHVLNFCLVFVGGVIVKQYIITKTHTHPHKKMTGACSNGWRSVFSLSSSSLCGVESHFKQQQHNVILMFVYYLFLSNFMTFHLNKFRVIWELFLLPFLIILYVRWARYNQGETHEKWEYILCIK